MNTHLRTSAVLRRTTTATAALLLSVSLAACGGDADDPDDRAGESSTTEEAESPSEEPTTEDTATEAPEETEPPAPPAVVPSPDELRSALITPADLPEGFTEEPDDGDTEDDTFEGTCLADIGEFSDALGFEPDAEAEVEYALEDQTGQAGVSSQVEAYADPATVAPAFAEFTDTLRGCTEVSTTDEDGVTYDLGITYDDTVDIPGADDQLRVEMSGTIDAGAESYDVIYDLLVTLSGQYISIVGAFSFGDAILAPVDLLAPAQAERVAAIG